MTFLENRAYSVVDVETTGLSPKRDRIVELAIVRVSSQGEVEDTWTTLINPQRSVGPTFIHRIKQTQVSDAPIFADLAPWVAKALQGTVLVAHNARFDRSFIETELAHSGLKLQGGPLPSLDTCQLARQYLQVPNHKLHTCCAEIGIALENAHCALDDALATAELLIHFKEISENEQWWHWHLEQAPNYNWPPLALVPAPAVRPR